MDRNTVSGSEGRALGRRTFVRGTVGLASGLAWGACGGSPSAERDGGGSEPDGGVAPAADGGRPRPDGAVARDPTAPAWFVAAPEGEWIEVAKSSDGAGILAVAPDPAPTNATDQDGLRGIADSFGGGVVDQSRAEFLLPQRGGHTQYCGNECYALALRVADPRWYRLLDPTPSERIPDVSEDSGSSFESAVYNDGRMRTVHGWSRVVFAADRVIHPTLDSVFSAGGDGPRRGFAYDRAFAGTPFEPGQPPLAWEDNAGPFEDLGAPPETGDGANYAKGPAVYARNTGLVWTFSGNSFGVGFTFDTNTWRWGEAFSAKADGVLPYTAWGLDLYDKNVIVTAMPHDGGYGGTGVAVFDPSDPSNGWYRKRPAASFGDWMTDGLGGTVRYGAAYDAQSRKIYCCIRSEPNVIRVLDVPDDPIASSSWEWRAANIAGLAPARGRGSATYGNFGLIEDMGTIDGATRRALVLFTDVDAPTYVMKLPFAGL